MTVWGITRNGQTVGINSWWTRDGNNVTLHQEIRYRSTTPVTDTSNNLTWSGHVTGSKPNALQVNKWTGETVLHTIVTGPTPIPTGSDITRTLNVTLANIDYAGQNLTASTTDTFPGFPNAPSNVTATRQSDTRVNLAWTNNGGTSINVHRWDNVSGWKHVAALGAVSSYADQSTMADRTYEYDIYANNGAGSSAAGTSNGVSTTPAAPSSLVAAKSGTTITLTWTNNSTISSGTVVEHGTVVGGVTTWDGSPLATLGVVTTYQHTSANPAHVHVYRVRATKSGLSSGYATSNTVALQMPPSSPTVTLNAAVLDLNVTALTITVGHNAVDASIQTSAEVRYRKVGAPAWTTPPGLGTGTTYTIPAGTLTNPDQYEVQARTKGDHPTWGPWSPSVLAQGSTTPTVTIGVSGSYTESRLVVPLAYFDAEATAMSGVTVTLKLDDVAIATRTAPPYEFTVQNDTTYTVEARVRDGSGLWSQWATTTVSVTFLDPPKPTVATTFDPDTGVVAVTYQTPAPTVGEAIPDHAQLHRWTDGRWLLLADELPTTGTVTDPLPQLGDEVAYKITAVSLAPSTRDSDASYVLTRTPWVFVNGGPGWSTRARLKAGAEVTARRGRDKVLHTFAGDQDAVEFVGTARTTEYSVNGNVGGYDRTTPTLGDWRAWEAVADLPAPLCYRDPLGRRLFGSISDVQVGHQAASLKGLATVSFTLRKVRHDE